MGNPEIMVNEAEANSAQSRPSDAEPVSATGPFERVNSMSRPMSQLPAYTPIEEVPPPEYSDSLGSVKATENGFGTTAQIANDGRIDININQDSKRLSNLLAPALRSQLSLHEKQAATAKPYIPPTLAAAPGEKLPPKLNVVIHVVGSRGDVQPFVALGQVLKNQYGHRVRLATHAVFKDFVEENGLEFFKIGGDPAELMAFMVKNPGLMPGFDSLRNGDVGKRRRGMYEIIVGCWRSCYEAGDGFGVEATDENLVSGAFVSSAGQDSARPFVADAIIANPPSFAHIHCAEKLGIPLHLMFTMPWSPTQSFPHPLANIESSNVDVKMASFMTYALVDMMTWQGLGDLINSFRRRKLGLEPISIIWAPGLLERHRIPYTYCWSPALIPKPKDWGPHIDISGFFFLSLASNFTPAPDLAEFLAAGPPPVYIGFGSIVVDDPNAMTNLIFEAVRKTGQRALVSKGWGGFGGDDLNIPEGIFMLGNVPHDWLFKQVSCVVHHGGAGTTAAGIALGRPTVVVPFFGDQPFWGDMIARAGAGPKPIPNKELTADKLAGAIMEALKPEALERAGELGAKIRAEKGTEVGAESFHEHLPLEHLRCLIAPTRAACWRIKRTDIRLSAFAATVLGNEGIVSFDSMKLYRPTEIVLEDGPPEPISGGAGAVVGTIGSLMMGVADIPVEVMKAMRITSDETPEARAKRKQKSSKEETPSRTSTDVAGSTTEGSSRMTLSPQSSEVALSSPGIATPTSLDEKQPALESRSHHGSLGDALSRSRLSSRSTSQVRGSSNAASRSSSPAPTKAAPTKTKTNVGFDDIVGSGESIRKIVGAGIRSPMDFTLGLARGFHNAPKLYGDDTVRPQERVSGFQSGLKAASKEFGYGLYDGISGLVTQPISGARKEGAAGFFKGIGKGVGGVVLKSGAGVFGIYGYTLQGISKEIQKLMGMSVQNYIVASRIAQGVAELEASTPEERADVVRRWYLLQDQLKNPRRKKSKPPSSKSAGKEPAKDDFFARFSKNRHQSSDERRRLAKEREAKVDEEEDEERDELFLNQLGGRPRPDSASSGQPFPSTLGSTAESRAFEDAIRQSITATSRGDKEQDKVIERALRASVAALHTSDHQDQTPDQVYERAVQASVAEANRARAEFNPSSSEQAPAGSEGLMSAADEKARLERINQQRMHDEYLAQALRHGLAESRLARSTNPAETATSSSEIDLSDHDIVDTESDVEDADYRRALEISMRETHRALDGQDNDDENDEELRRAISESKSLHQKTSIENDEDLKKIMRESKSLHQEHEEKLKKQMTEEEIMLEYVRKQSLLDEEREKALKEARARARQADSTGGQGSSTAAEAAEPGNEDDEELRRAIEESLKIK